MRRVTDTQAQLNEAAQALQDSRASQRQLRRRPLIIQIDEEDSCNGSPLSSSISTGRSLWDGTMNKLIRSPLGSPKNSPLSYSPGNMGNRSPLNDNKKSIRLTVSTSRNDATLAAPVTDPIPTEKFAPYRGQNSQKRLVSLASIGLPGIFSRLQRYSMPMGPGDNESNPACIARQNNIETRTGPTTDPGDMESSFSCRRSTDEIAENEMKRSNKHNRSNTVTKSGLSNTVRKRTETDEKKDISILSRANSLARWPRTSFPASLVESSRAGSAEGNRGKLSHDVARLRRFIPDLLVAFLSDHALSAGSTAGASDFCEAACACLDISGFSALSEKFCIKGEAGLDDLVGIINSCMGSLMNLVYFFGGDVVKLAGDALYCVFPRARNSTLAQACRQAVACCSAAREKKLHGLTVHAGVGAGEICFAALGAKDPSSRWECLISGDPIQQVAEALEEAGSGEVVLHRSCWKLVAPWVMGSHLTVSGNFKLKFLVPGNSILQSVVGNKAFWAGTRNLSSVGYNSNSNPKWHIKDNEKGPRALINASTISSLKKFVPAPVINSITAGTGSFDYLAEIRQVTTLFMKWEDYCPVEHRDLISLVPHFAAVQSVLKAHDGFLRQFLVDDKGCVLIACWGVPSASFPDNCERALEVAIRVHQQLSLLDMKTSIGISTGRALCSNIGSELRCEYAMVGDVINLAARLMGKADGRVLCDAATQENICDRSRLASIMSFKPLDEMKVKGKQVLIQPFHVIANRPPRKSSAGGGAGGRLSFNAQLKQRGPLPLMIGRNKLRQQIQEALVELPKRNSPLFLIIDGHTGMGKTFLIRHVAAMSQDILSCKVLTYDLETYARRHLPYSGLIAMFSGLWEVDEVHSMDGVSLRQKLLHYLRLTYDDDIESALNLGLPAMHKVLCSGWGHKHGANSINVCTPTAALSSTISSLRATGPELYAQHYRPQNRRSASAAFHRIFNSTKLADGLSPFANTKRRFSRAVKPEVKNPHQFNETELNNDGYSIEKKREIIDNSSIDPKTPPRPINIEIGMQTHTQHNAMLTDHAAGSFYNSNITPALSQSELTEELARLFESSLAGQPLVICLDNVHYLDPHSWRVLLRLANCQKCPCLFVLTSQPMDERRWSFAHNSPYITCDKPVRRKAQHYFKLLNTPGACQRFELKSLTYEEVSDALVTMGMGSGQPVPPEVIQRVLELSGGNPFWCAEIAAFSKEVTLDQFMSTFGTIDNVSESEHSYSSNATIAPSKASYQKTRLELNGGNLRLAHMVTHRLESLSVKEQLVARHASVIGLEFPLRVLSGILPSSLVSSARDALLELEKSRFVEQVEEISSDLLSNGTTSYTTYRFHHPLVQQALYNITPIRDRRKIHYAVAKFYVGEDAQTGSTCFTDVAMHCLKAEMSHADVVQYAAKAAAQVLASHEFNQCLELLELGSNHAQTASEHFELWAVAEATIRILKVGPTTSSDKMIALRRSNEFACSTNALILEDFLKQGNNSAPQVMSPNTWRSILESNSAGQKGTEESRRRQDGKGPVSRGRSTSRQSVPSWEQLAPLGMSKDALMAAEAAAAEIHPNDAAKQRVAVREWQHVSRLCMLRCFVDCSTKISAGFKKSVATKPRLKSPQVFKSWRGASPPRTDLVGRQPNVESSGGAIWLGQEQIGNGHEWSTFSLLAQIEGSREKCAMRTYRDRGELETISIPSSKHCRSQTAHNFEFQLSTTHPNEKLRARSLSPSTEFTTGVPAVPIRIKPTSSYTSWDIPVVTRRRKTLGSALSAAHNIATNPRVSRKCSRSPPPAYGNNSSHTRVVPTLNNSDDSNNEEPHLNRRRTSFAGQVSSTLRQGRLISVLSPRASFGSRVMRRSTDGLVNHAVPDQPDDRPTMNRTISSPITFEFSQFTRGRRQHSQLYNVQPSRPVPSRSFFYSDEISQIASALSEVTSNDGESETTSAQPTPISSPIRPTRNRWWSRGLKLGKEKGSINSPLNPLNAHDSPSSTTDVDTASDVAVLTPQLSTRDSTKQNTWSRRSNLSSGFDTTTFDSVST